jgi:pyruvate/2-oxoglutarate dehydrogenase complex dihydrolipoamide dehydrogenase (E3) component
MEKQLRPDICVIGAGSGGLTVAAAAASFGVSVVLVEKARMGGDCLNYGCVPSKAMLAAARRAHERRHDTGFGLPEIDAEIDFRAVNRHVHEVIAAISPNDSVERFTALGVRVIQAEARFADRRTVVAGDVEIRARRFVIATGASPVMPPIPGLDGVDFLTNETIFERKRRPSRLVVVGGGPVGVELALAHRRLGSDVVLIEAATLLAREDPEAVDVIRKGLRTEGVDIREATTVERVERHGRTGARLHLQGPSGDGTVDGTHLLLAIGRKPVLRDLGLEKAGIRYSGDGVAVDARLRTSNRRVYAIGDAAGGAQFTHLASHHAGIVLRAILFRLRARADYAHIPRVTFTDPELAHVGMSEAEARLLHRTIRVLRWPYAENDRAQAERTTRGFIKIVADRRGRLLGVTIVGARAGELIAMWSLALSKRMRVHDIAGLVFAYPTLAEIGKRASISYFAEQTRRPWVRRLIGFLRIFG